MDTNEKNLALCKAMGWKLWEDLIKHGGEHLWLHPDHSIIRNMEEHIKAMTYARAPRQLPNFFSDEKAILDATRAQEPVVQSLAAEILIAMKRDAAPPYPGYDYMADAIHAPASDRAEALGQALHIF